MNLNDISKLLWILLPSVFYLTPILSEFSVFTFAPYLLYSVLFLYSKKFSFQPRTFIILILFFLSNFLRFTLNANPAGMLSSLTLFLFLTTSLSIKGISLKNLNDIVYRVFLGIVILFVFILFLPLLSSFSYTIGSWYLLAIPEAPLVRTTFDGPLCLIIITAAIYILIKYSKVNVIQTLIFVCILVIVIYTLLVFNRRTVIVYFFFLIPLVYTNQISKPYFYKILFVYSFLFPIYFGSFLLYAHSLCKLPLFHEFLLRSNDLNSDINLRLSGWIKAITAFRNISFADFFKFHAILVRSKIERYNHFHNGYIQLYYEQGIFGFTVLMLLITSMIKRIKNFKFINFKQYKYLLLPPIILGLTLLICTTESVFRYLYLTNIFFILSCFLISKTYEIIKDQKNEKKLSLS